MARKVNVNDYIGLIVNDIEVVDAYRKSDGKYKRICFKIKCHCGNIKDGISSYPFLKGLYVSCGCKQKERANKLSLQKKEKAKAEYLGMVYKTNEGYEIKIINYIDNHNVEFCFLDEYEYKSCTTLQNIKNGEVKNPFHRSVLGVGYYGDGIYGDRENGAKHPSYVTWFSMMNRCYGDKHKYSQYSYKGCTVCEEWHNYQNFAKWYEDNYYNCEEELELDKDIIIYGNKLYSPETCLFVPKLVNTSYRYSMNEIVRIACVDKYRNKLPNHVLEHMMSNIEQYRKSM